jgi:hypothetical protein
LLELVALGEEMTKVREQRTEIAKIIRFNLPLMNRNPMMIQEVADAILFYLMEKKDK